MRIGNLFLAQQALEPLFQEKLPVRTAYALGKIMDPVTRELNYFESMRMKLMEKHTHEGELNREEFLKEYNELTDVEIDIELPRIPLKDILDSGIDVTPLALHILITLGVLTED